LPKLRDGQPTVRTDIALQAILATRGAHVGHVGRESQPTTTREHWIAKHKYKAAHRPFTSSVDDTAPVK
jgi:hypothetical protein